ncbi:MAG: hypothetical protein JJT76_06900 [Clostridiaceae bacterium]|nr:hypothetical protein [Clostridiaceae bacterium]
MINENLWAVKFSHIPYIKEIDYKPDDTIPQFEEPARITSEGLLILNKDHPGFSLYKDMFAKLMKKSDKQLKKAIDSSKKIKNKNKHEVLLSTLLQVEEERRNKIKKKVVKKLWQQ